MNVLTTIAFEYPDNTQGEIQLRLATPSDADKLTDFYTRVPPDTRFLFDDDVTNPETIRNWLHNTPNTNHITLIALDQDRIAGDCGITWHPTGRSPPRRRIPGLST